MATTRRDTLTSPPRARALILLPVADRAAGRDPALRLEEATGLAEALDLEVVAARLQPVRRLTPATYLGQGRVEDLKREVAETDAQIVIIDTALSPVQQRNLETALGAKVIDRTGLILEIFGRRARTREGIVQVELARQAYERSRLVRTWTHLERQRGGLGKTGGPGETQIELDRRLIAQRIDRLKVELEDVRRTRGLQREARRRARLPAVVLVGYTNAGKSSLFNRLTSAGVLARDMPFATLDPTARLVRLPSGRSVIMSDTVGFITDLPTELVAAFRATLEEVLAADVLVHVRDIAHPETDGQRADVLAILDQLAADAKQSRPPIVEAWNKLDKLSVTEQTARRSRASGDRDALAVATSTVTGEGIETLLETIDRLAFGPTRLLTIRLAPEDGRRRAMIAARGRIHEERIDEEGRLVVIAELPVSDGALFEAEEGTAFAAE